MRYPKRKSETYKVLCGPKSLIADQTKTVLIIEYAPNAFPEKFGPKLTRPDQLRCAWPDIIWAGLTVGRRNLRHVIRPDTYAYFEIVYRSTMLYTNLQAADYRPGLWGPLDTHIIQSPAFRELDAPEKSANSYYLSLTLTKLFVEKLLATPWLLHLDTYAQSLAQLPSPSPDLVGLGKNTKWLVAEAKGRSNWLSRRTLRRLKSRSQALIAGQKPALLIGLACYFTAQNKILKAYLEDPVVNTGSESPNLALTPKAYLTSYYALLFDLLQADYGGAPVFETYQDRTFRLKAIPEADLHIGLDEQIFQRLAGDDFSLERFFASRRRAPQIEATEQITVGSDGVYVSLGERWSPTRMHLPPPERVG
ncbi:MAG: hypothetical protein KDI62_13360 [Anaerolineae bacterium]|nr:hypothetical protein [Anaerolineae bacterium]MCB9104122.1 hypothetical protein [Anaerolineales bacterium]